MTSSQATYKTPVVSFYELLIHLLGIFSTRLSSFLSNLLKTSMLKRYLYEEFQSPGQLAETVFALVCLGGKVVPVLLSGCTASTAGSAAGPSLLVL